MTEQNLAYSEKHQNWLKKVLNCLIVHNCTEPRLLSRQPSFEGRKIHCWPYRKLSMFEMSSLGLLMLLLKMQNFRLFPLWKGNKFINEIHHNVGTWNSKCDAAAWTHRYAFWNSHILSKKVNWKKRCQMDFQYEKVEVRY